MPEMLLLCNRPARGANADTILEHLDAIHAMPGWRVRELSMLGDIPKRLDLNQFDAIGIHYTLHISDPTNHWLSAKAMHRIAAFQGIKCIWMHDEYRRVDEVAAKLRHMGINTIFTVIPEKVAATVYASDRINGANVHTILAGYVSPALEAVTAPDFDQRAVDIGYRARRPPFWLGTLGQEKINIGLRTKLLAKQHGLTVDISVEEADRIYGEQWITFLKATKATLCVESGSSVIDFSGEIELEVEAAIKKNPYASFSDVADIIERADGALVINCISPRIFEMAACRTLIVAYPGKYSDIIEPWKHYLPLEKDFSNFDEIVSFLKQPERCKEIIERAYNDLIASRAYSYSRLSDFCADCLSVPEISKSSISDIDWFFQRHSSMQFIMHNYMAYGLQKTVLNSPLRSLLIRIWLMLPKSVQDRARPLMKAMGR